MKVFRQLVGKRYLRGNGQVVGQDRGARRGVGGIFQGHAARSTIGVLVDGNQVAQRFAAGLGHQLRLALAFRHGGAKRLVRGVGLIAGEEGDAEGFIGARSHARVHHRAHLVHVPYGDAQTVFHLVADNGLAFAELAVLIVVHGGHGEVFGDDVLRGNANAVEGFDDRIQGGAVDGAGSGDGFILGGYAQHQLRIVRGDNHLRLAGYGERGGGGLRGSILGQGKTKAQGQAQGQ